MPQPLPAPIVPSAAGLIDAQRLGHSDYLENQKRELMQRAGGLAAAGDMNAARNELYKGGEFGEARGISAEQRAAASHAQSMSTAKLEKALQAQGLMGRLAGSIQTQEQLDTAKARLKAIGLDVGNVTMDQLPQLRDQALSVQEQLANEMQTRKLNILQQKVDAKAGAPVKLTEGQAKARGFLGMANQAEETLRGTPESPGLLGVEGKGASPVSRNDRALYENLPSSYRTMFLDKKGKQYFQAAMQFIRAKLRRESGATISPKEFTDDYDVFFPVAGDDGKTLMQKAAARKQVIEGLRIEGALSPGTAPGEAAPAPAGAGNTVDPASMSDEDLLKNLGM